MRDKRKMLQMHRNDMVLSNVYADIWKCPHFSVCFQILASVAQVLGPLLTQIYHDMTHRDTQEHTQTR